MIPRFAMLMLVLLSLVAGCGRHPRIARLSETAVVVAFGDSLTHGTGAAANESYPAVLAELIGRRVVNAGVPGEDSSGGLRRLPEVLERERPALVVLCHGGNDRLRKQDEALTRANLEAMVSRIRDAGADIILLGVPKPGLLLRAPPLYREIASRHRLPCDVRTLAAILSSPSLKSDPIHPNAAGYRRLAGSVAALIREAQGR